MVMDPFLKLKRIEVDTPPASPTRFDDDSFDVDFIQDITSPTKRARISGGSGPVKRRKKDAAQNSQKAPYEAYAPDVGFCEDDVPLSGYAMYVTAVAERLAGFYPLSNDIFVVQEWDNKTNCVKVCQVSLFTHKLFTSLRTHGITCNA